MSHKPLKFNDVKEFFTYHLSNFKINKHLIKDIRKFRLKWMTKNDEYINFLNGNLIGVYNISFSVLDDAEFMENVLKIDNYNELQELIIAKRDNKGNLLEGTDGIEKNFKIGSNIIYQIIIYLLYLIYNDKHLSSSDKEDGMRELCLIMQYRMFTSLYNWYFKYKISEAVANTLYSKLSNKFLIKQLDTWQDVFEVRGESCYKKDGINLDRLKKYNSESAVRIASDIQVKIREQLKQIYMVLIEILENDEVIDIEKATYVGGERNEEQLNDVNKGYYIYVNNALDAASSLNNFIDGDLLDITVSLYNKVDRNLLYEFIKDMLDENFLEHKKLNDIISTILNESFQYLVRIDINIEDRRNLSEALVSIKQYWSSSKVKNENMDKVKEELFDLAHRSTGRKTGWLLTSLLLSFITYTFLRSLKK